VDPRRYYVIGTTMSELGPFTHEELGEALASGQITRSSMVRTSLGTGLGTVDAVLKNRPRGEPVPRRVGFPQAAQRSPSVTQVTLGILVLLIAVMVLALRPSAPPAYSPPAGSTAADGQPPASGSGGRTAPANVQADPPGPPPIALGIHPGMTVTTLLWASDPVWALKATDQAGASHRAVITNSEVAANALDSNLATKYYNNYDDGTHRTGIGSGLVVNVRSAVVVTAFQIATANDESGRDPLSITIEGSNQVHAEEEGSSAFTLLYSGSTGLKADPGRKAWGPAVVFENTTAYRTYRMLVTTKRDPEVFGIQFSEFRLGTPAP